jgi:predicted small lipoprotein YifL
MSDLKKLAMILGICAALAACGQTGKLYLPGESGEVTTRSTQTPPESAGTSNSPRTVDSPPAPATPAPEVTAPDGSPAEKDNKGKKTPPSEPQKK